jgi:hypothetical protein
MSQMPTPEDIEKATAIHGRIIQALVDRGGGEPTCPVCRQHKFTLGGYVHLPVSPSPAGGHFMVGGPAYPCITLICTTCGAMQLVNVLTLGFVPADYESLTLPAEWLHGG